MAIKVTSSGTTSYDANDHNKEHANTSTGSTIPKDVLDTAIKNGANKNTITAINVATGEKTVYEGYVVNGVTWSPSGDRIVPGGNSNQSGLIPGKIDVSQDYVNGSATVTYNDPPKTTPSPPSSPSVVPDPPYTPPPDPPYPPAPSQPTYEVFSTPKPTFSSDLQRVHKFTYFFGVDKIEVKSLELNQNCCRVTREIAIDEIDYLELEVKESINSHSSIEYSIIDGDKEVPIAPNNKLEITNERIFYGLPTRFEINKNKEVIIKKDSIALDLTFEEAHKKSDGVYTISYTAKEGTSYKPNNSKIKIKFVLRLYDKLAEPPFVQSASLKLIGGNTLWQESI